MIEIGDRVIVYKPRPCCGNDSRIGFVFTVETINTVSDAYCAFCGKSHPGTVSLYGKANRGFLFEEIRKLPRLKDEEKEEEIEKTLIEFWKL